VNPSPDTILRPGDPARIFGLPEQLQTFGMRDVIDEVDLFLFAPRDRSCDP